MTIETHLDSARDRVHSEREAVRRTQTAYRRFVSRVRDLSPDSARSGQHATAFAAGGTRLSGVSTPTETGCAEVRAAFEDTVRPHSVADIDGEEPLLETIRSELSDSIAMAVAPTTAAGLTSDLRDAILAEARSRRVELRTMNAALDSELEQIEAASSAVEPIVEWLATADETPLTDLGFEELRERHAILETHRDSCERLLTDRQAFLREATGRAAQTGIAHRTLVEYFYQDFPVDHPILSTVVRVDELCTTSQRTVRNHLVRRV